MTQPTDKPVFGATCMAGCLTSNPLSCRGIRRWRSAAPGWTDPARNACGGAGYDAGLRRRYGPRATLLIDRGAHCVCRS